MTGPQAAQRMREFDAEWARITPPIVALTVRSSGSHERAKCALPIPHRSPCLPRLTHFHATSTNAQGHEERDDHAGLFNKHLMKPLNKEAMQTIRALLSGGAL